MLMGRVTTVCSQYDNSWVILVSDDWLSAKLNTSDELGLMHCEKGKDLFRTCEGPQVPDAGFTATFVRSGDRISARLDWRNDCRAASVCPVGVFHLGKGQALPSNLKTWTLEYSLTGGIAGLNRHLRLTQDGNLTVSANSEPLGSRISRPASAGLMAKIAKVLSSAQIEASTYGTPIPDALNGSLALISDGSKYELDVPDSVHEFLNNIIDDTLKESLLGNWWESE